jgi:DNA-directed RNA polymerase specialized sigma24 family protein
LEDRQWERLVQVMEQVAARDRAAVVMLYREFGSMIAGVLRRHLGRLGVGGVDRDELDGLVLDACIELYDCGGAWLHETGVAPWTWADKRLAALVSSWVGQHAEELDERSTAVAAPRGRSSREAAPIDVLAGAGDPMCRLLRRAFDVARVSERDRSLLLEMQLQRSLGDPSPAETVATLHGLSAAAVRQAVKRAKDRLRELVSTTPAFEPLRDIVLLA